MILAIDQGTTGTHVLLVDESGAVRAKAYREITQHFPKPGWVEDDAEEIWQTVLDCSAEILSGEPPGLALAGIGITNQRETFVVWDRATLRPVAPAMVWQYQPRRPGSRRG
jgi:glycerol kinase